MSNEVYANGREVSCKAANGKSICAFPDVCLSPPSPPAGPVPIPYPNTGVAADTSDGSKTVQISGQEVMLKDSSDFKKSTGDEAATKSLGMGVVTHQITGKVYFTSWSMDVKIEGENAVRHLDMMTHNHMSTPGNTPPWPYTDAMAPSTGPCAGQPKRCKTTPYKDGCPDGQTPHHIVPDHCSKQPGKGGLRYEGCSKITHGNAPCVCVTGEDKSATTPSGNLMQHGRIHGIFDEIEDSQPNNKWTYADCRDAGAQSAAKVTKCDPDCLAAQCDHYYKDQCNVKDGTKLRADSSGKKDVKGLKPSANYGTGF
jgi:hypothetical protein